MCATVSIHVQSFSSFQSRVTQQWSSNSPILLRHVTRAARNLNSHNFRADTRLVFILLLSSFFCSLCSRATFTKARSIHSARHAQHVLFCNEPYVVTVRIRRTRVNERGLKGRVRARETIPFNPSEKGTQRAGISATDHTWPVFASDEFHAIFFRAHFF